MCVSVRLIGVALKQVLGLFGGGAVPVDKHLLVLLLVFLGVRLLGKRIWVAWDLDTIATEDGLIVDDCEVG